MERDDDVPYSGRIRISKELKNIIVNEVIGKKRNRREVALSFNLTYRTVNKYILKTQMKATLWDKDGRPPSLDENDLKLLDEHLINFPDCSDWELRCEIRKIFKENRIRNRVNDDEDIIKPLSQRSVKRYVEIVKKRRQFYML